MSGAEFCILCLVGKQRRQFGNGLQRRVVDFSQRLQQLCFVEKLAVLTGQSRADSDKAICVFGDQGFVSL